MAYGLKYQSEFYNRYGKLVQVQIAKDDYVGSVTNLRSVEVQIEVNYQDHNNPIIGTGAKIIIVNTEAFNALEDLLTSLEKNFLCTIVYGGATVFKGFSICDLNEQEFLPNSKITLQFTDYLRRLEGNYLTCLQNISENTSYADVVWEAIESIGLHTSLYVNSTLFETTMDQGTGDTFLEQTYFENTVFFTDPVNYDDTYTILNKTLLPAGAYLYSLGNKWVLERQEDITRAGAWVYLANSSTAGVTTANLAQSYNKQDGDFQYKDTSQKIAYSSGVNMLILNLKEKEQDTLAFNDFSVDMPTVSDETPNPGTLAPRTWYIHENAINIETGYDYRGMASWVKWQYTPDPNDRRANDHNGLFYCFDAQFNINPDSPTELSINYTMSIEAKNWLLIDEVIMRFILRMDGGSYSGRYIGERDMPGDTTMPAVVNEPYIWTTTVTLSKATTTREKVYNVSATIDFSSQFIEEDSNIIFPSLWQMLGKPTTQRFILFILPPVVHQINLTGGSNSGDSYFFTSTDSYLGDVSIKITEDDTPNKLTYTANENFIRTEEIDLDLFDLSNINYSNGLMTPSTSDPTELIKTQLWESENNPTAIPIADIFAKNRYRNNYRTIHTLKATILYDGHLKPFSVITDDNLPMDSSTNRTLILLNYTWDLNNGTYDIEAEEYTDEEIIIADPGEDSSGGTGSSGTMTLDAPTWVSVTQTAPGGHIYVQWNAVTGATGYRLRRTPSWYLYPDGSGAYWAMYSTVVYSGGNDFYADHIEEEGTGEDGMTVYYEVCAYNSNVESAYSSTETVTWNA